MIRQWTIFGALSLLLAWLGWGFANNALLYDPMAGLSNTAAVAAGTEDAAQKARAAWSPAIAEKNVFSPVRAGSLTEASQFMQPEPEIAPEPPKIPPIIRLSGIIKADDGSFTAYVQIGEAPVSAVREGDRLSDVSVQSIENRRAVFLWDGQRIVVELPNPSLLMR